MLSLGFSPGLLTAGATAGIVPSTITSIRSIEGTCVGQNCATVTIDSLIISGTVSSGSPVPEPGTLLLFASGLAGLIGWRFQKHKIA